MLSSPSGCHPSQYGFIEISVPYYSSTLGFVVETSAYQFNSHQSHMSTEYIKMYTFLQLWTIIHIISSFRWIYSSQSARCTLCSVFFKRGHTGTKRHTVIPVLLWGLPAWKTGSIQVADRSETTVPFNRCTASNPSFCNCNGGNEQWHQLEHWYSFW